MTDHAPRTRSKPSGGTRQSEASRRDVLRFTRYSLLIMLLVLLLAACTETPQIARTPVRLRLGDAADQTAVIDRLLETYAQDREWVIFSHDELSSAESLDRLRNDHLDLAIVPATQDLATVRVWTSGLAYDSLAIVVHPGNPIGGLTLTQLRDVFQGGYADWTALGGTGEVIPVSREANSIARVLFEERVMSGRAVTLNAILKGSTGDVIDFVAQTPGAIGYASLSHLDERVKVINLDGVRPTPETAAAGQYLLAAPLYLIARAEPVGDAREFVAWLLSNEGQSMLSRSGLGRVK